MLTLRDAPEEVAEAMLYAQALPDDLLDVLRDDSKAQRGWVRAQFTNAPGHRPGDKLGGILSGTATFTTGSDTSKRRAVLITGIQVGGSNRRLSGGATIRQLARPYEFGSQDYPQFAPARRRGRVFYPLTYRTLAPRVLARWTSLAEALFDQGVRRGR